MAASCRPNSLFFLLLFPLLFLLGNCTEFQVGDDAGWAVPKSGDLYNDWASRNRFQVNDTVHFKYEKDSVLVVTEEEYKKCHSSQPIFFSNNGDTFYQLDRPGLFYFISGVSGHCERGLKMIIKVLEPAPAAAPPSPQSADDTAESTPTSSAVGNLPLAMFPWILVALLH